MSRNKAEYPQQIAHRLLVIDDHYLWGDSVHPGDSSLRRDRGRNQPEATIDRRDLRLDRAVGAAMFLTRLSENIPPIVVLRQPKEIGS